MHFCGRNLLLGCFKGGSGHTRMVGKGAVELQVTAAGPRRGIPCSGCCHQAQDSSVLAQPTRDLPCPQENMARTQPGHPGPCLFTVSPTGPDPDPHYGLTRCPSLNPSPGMRLKPRAAPVSPSCWAPGWGSGSPAGSPLLGPTVILTLTPSRWCKGILCSVCIEEHVSSRASGFP